MSTLEIEGAGAAPDFPQTRLAFRCWRLDTVTMRVRSINDPGQKGSWIARAMSAGQGEPEGGWPHDQALTATCAVSGRKPRKKNKDDDDPPPHGAIPGAACSCGIYATTSLNVISTYLSREVPVLGVVELGGRVIPADQGYRAEAARLAVILLIDTALTAPHRILGDLAAAYRIPAVVPHSADPEQYRDLAGQRSVAAEAEEWLAGGPGA